MRNLIVFRGKPGVGKSTLSDALAKQLGYFVIHKDDINNLIFEAFGANRESSNVVYKLIIYFSKLLLLNGRDVVVDCSLSHKIHYELFKELSSETKSHLNIVEVVLSNKLDLEKRLNSRTDLPVHRIKTISDIKKQGLNYEKYQTENTFVIENTGDLETVISKLVENLKV